MDIASSDGIHSPASQAILLEHLRLRCHRTREHVLLAESVCEWNFMLPSIHFVTDGECEIEAQNGLWVRLSPGDVAIVIHSKTRPFPENQRPSHGYLRPTVPPDTCTTILSAVIDSDAVWTSTLLSLLPPIIHLVARGQKSPIIVSATSHLLSSTRGRLPGASVVADSLMTLIVVEAIREQLSRLPPFSTGLSQALQDIHLGPALVQMHCNPARDWTVDSLASVSRLSRSQFASRFREVLGESPIGLLSSIRITLACELLRTNCGLKEIAAQVGYSSASALSVAFRRQLNMTPIQYRESMGQR